MEEVRRPLRAFISQPMNNISDEEILMVRNEAIKKIKNIFGENTEIIDSFIENSQSENTIKLLGHAIQCLADADIVYLCKGWQYYRGCRIEHECAVQYSIDTYYE